MPTYAKAHLTASSHVNPVITMSPAMPMPTPCSSVISTPSLASPSSQSPPHLHQPPLLVMPLHGSYNRPCYLYNPVDAKMSFTNTRFDNDRNCRCVGSSKGWLILQNQGSDDSEFSLFLFSPLCMSVRNIVLPCFNRPSDFEISWIRKSILTLNPVLSGYKFGVVFLYGMCYNKIALLMIHDVRDDENKWIDLEFSHGEYADVVSNQEFLFGLLTCGSVDVWDLRSSSDGGSVDKKMRIKTSSIDFGYVTEYGEKFRDLYTTKIYLVESQGSLFLLLRVIGEFVKEDGEVVNEGALLDDEVYSHLVLPYRTKNFYVYKLDSELKNWVKVESLGDQILFVGLNQSMSASSTLDIQGCQGNSIYFTDDYWDHIDIQEHDMYGGHDMGIYHLSDKRVEEMFEMMRMVPPPVWVDQNISGL